MNYTSVKLSREHWNLIFTFIHLLFKNEHKYIKNFLITINHNRKHCNLKLQTYFLRHWTPFEIYFLVFNIFLTFKQTSTFCFHFLLLYFWTTDEKHRSKLEWKYLECSRKVRVWQVLHYKQNGLNMQVSTLDFNCGIYYSLKHILNDKSQYCNLYTIFTEENEIRFNTKNGFKSLCTV